MNLSLTFPAAAVLLVLGLSACAPPLEEAGLDAETEAASAGEASAPAPAPVATCDNCGTVTAIQPIRQKGEGSGAGALAGAVIGGVIGNQFGGGRGKDAATVIGAVGGGVAGHEVEKNMKASTYYQVTVQMEAGGTRTVNVGSTAGIAVGTPVRVVGNNLELRT
jgi:uncharacterized protein YcfJ